MSWHALPTELHIAVVRLLPHDAVRALAATAAAPRALCLPAIFASVSLPDADALHAFVRHVPPRYGAYVRSLAVAATGAPDALLAVLAACTRLTALSLSLAAPLDPARIVPAFARLAHLRTFEIRCGSTEDVSPVSERLVVALAASLPALTRLSMSRITRSAIHVDPCDVPYNVPIVTNDFDVPPHPTLGTDLALPSLLRLPSLRTLEIRDTWLGCDTKLPVSSSLESLVLTGSMYATDTDFEAHACSAWIRACHSLRSLELGTALACLASPLPRVPHLHINASRLLPDDLPQTLAALDPASVESISITYEPSSEKLPQDSFARECALDDLQDWTSVIDAFLLGHSTEEWSALSRVQISFAPDVHACWDL